MSFLRLFLVYKEIEYLLIVCFLDLLYSFTYKIPVQTHIYTQDTGAALCCPKGFIQVIDLSGDRFNAHKMRNGSTSFFMSSVIVLEGRFGDCEG